MQSRLMRLDCLFSLPWAKGGDGIDGLGAGGGAQKGGTAGDGGDGVVIIRYKYQQVNYET